MAFVEIMRNNFFSSLINATTFLDNRYQPVQLSYLGPLPTTTGTPTTTAQKSFILVYSLLLSAGH